jgi:hypothetical protein
MNDQEHDPGDEIVYHPEDNGKPCFGCYFGAVFDSLTDDELGTIPLDAEDLDGEDPEAVEYMRRVGAAWATVADSVAHLAIQIAGETAPELMEPFHERIDHMIALILAPKGNHAH